MKVLHCKDLANHASPESCGGSGNNAAEALTGESVGGTLSSEITDFRVPTSCLGREGSIEHSVTASYGRTWRSLSILACVEKKKRCQARTPQKYRNYSPGPILCPSLPHIVFTGSFRFNRSPCLRRPYRGSNF